MMNMIKGFIIAVSMLVPGVSGATMMMTLNVYTQSLEFLTGVTQKRIVHKKMMIHLFIGALVGLVGFSWVMIPLLQHYGFYLRFFFLGSILFGLWVLVKQINVKLLKIHHIVYLIMGIIIAIALSIFEPVSLVEHQTNFWFLMLGGIGIAVALILPGISTSFVLLTMGLYEPLLQAIRHFDLRFLSLLFVGILIGTFLMSRLLVYLLKTHPVGTTVLIVGFVLGSMWEVIPAIPEVSQLPIAVLMIVLGLLFMVGVEQFGYHFDSEE